MKRIIFILILSGLVVVSLIIVLFSWLPDPLLSKLGWLPNEVGQWADQPGNINIRTAVPMLGWGLLAGMILIFKPAKRRWWIIAAIIGIGLLSIAEIGQFLIPNRHPDWGDVAWGGLGLVAGLFIARAIGLFLQGFKLFSVKYKSFTGW